MSLDLTKLFDGGNPKRLEDVDLPRIGSYISVGEDELHAFMDVEASGSGFDSKGRVKMLFEPHIFWKQLGPGKKRDKAAKLGLAYPRWRKTGYPADSYPRLKKAMAIDETAALMSASWGLGQIMGFNHIGAGYQSVQNMIADFMVDEDNHLEAMVRLLEHFNIDDDLRARNWRKIEDVWNGGGFNGTYARKMEQAFGKWQKIPDTPYKPESKPTVPEKTPASPGAAGTGAIVAGGGAAVASGVPWERVLLFCGVALAVLVIVLLVLKFRSRK